ncbi:MAG: laminin G domain-containing protein [Kiritimatiellae bacterium]|nr:laminin G domain-containing protein [Kiritimatiellia bacterium]
MKVLSPAACGRFAASCLTLFAVVATGLPSFAENATETIAYWSFGTNGFHDVSGNGHDLVGVEIAESDAAYVTLNQGRTDQYLKTAAALDLSGETAVTFECWWRQYPAKPASVTCLLMSSASPNIGTGGFIITNNGRIQSQYRTTTSGWHIDYTDVHSTAWNDGMWHHVAYVVERSRTDHFSCRLYVDGVRTSNGGGSGSLPSLFNDFFLIGGGSETYEVGNNYFRGYIDDVRISRGVVAPENFLKYPTVGKTMRADDGKLPVVAYWPFGGKRGKDVSGNGFDLAMSDKVPMLSGTPKVAWGERTSWVGDFKCTNLPFSVFSTAGVTIEFFAWTDSGDTGGGNVLTVSPDLYYYNHAGAFRVGSNTEQGGHKSMAATFRCKDSGKYASATSTLTDFGQLNDGKWRHYAAVYDPKKTGKDIMQLYIDGIAASNSTTDVNQGAIALLDETLYFQRININDSKGSPYVGSFDDVRITAGALTPDQFMASRSVGSTVALYRFDMETLEDQTGNGHELVHENGTATFGDGGYPLSGPGLVLTGKKGNKEWIHTENPVDFSNTKAMTIEFDYNSENPTEEKDSSLYVIAASSNATTERGGFVIYRTGNALQAQFRKNPTTWVNYYNQTLGAMLNGYRRCRYMVDANTAGTMTFNLCVDGTSTPNTQSETFDSLGTPVLCFGYSPSYNSATSTDPCWMKGKILRVAVSDVKLDTVDYVLDNLPPNPETKATLAYWDFARLDGLTAEGVKLRNDGLFFEGTASATTTNLTLSALTQATIECFVCFGNEPSSGTLLSLGSGAGSFAIASDATAGTLSGSFVPYDHLAASNGGTAALAPLAGRRAWHHVALVIDRTKSGADAVRFYVDYQRAMPAGRAWDRAATILDGSITIGSGFTGRIDDLRVSAGALEPSEFIQSVTYTPDGMIISIR